MQDIRYALRLLLRSPGFSAIAVLTLALGIGATSAVFSIVYGVLLRPLPYSEPERLATMQITYPGGHQDATDGARATFWKEHQQIFENAAILGGSTEANLERGNRAERIRTAHVTADFFRVLRVRPALGRVFAPGEDERGAAPVAVLSYGLWQRGFGGSRTVLGRGIVLGDRNFTIIGVAPPGMDSTLTADAWTPLYLQGDSLFGGTNYLFLGRLRDGISLDHANAQARVLAAQFLRENPKSARPRESAGVFSYRRDATRSAREPLAGMFAAVGLVLLLACVNVANLLLARVSRRRRELAVRLAIGAGRIRILRQLLTESICLSLAGGVLGLVVAQFAVEAIVYYRPLRLPRLAEVSLDPFVLFCTLGAAVLTGLLFGLAPALQALRADVQAALQEGGARTGGSRGSRRMLESLVPVEFALAIVLLIGAGLLIESFIHLNLVDPGFDAAHVLTLQVTLSGRRYATSEQVTRFTQTASERLRHLPGVVAAATTNYLPLEGGFNTPLASIEGRPARPGEFLGNLEWFGVTRDFFQVLSTRVLAGRALRDSDTAASAPVVVVNSTFAKRYFPNESAIGRRIRISWEGDGAREIVGIAADMHEMDLRSVAQPDVFVPVAQVSTAVNAEVNAFMPTTLLVRTAGDPMLVSRRALDAMRSLDPMLPVFHVRSLAEVAGDSVGQNRFLASLLGGFAVIALVLAAIGVYGVMSCSVAERTREFGIRSALGAQPRAILSMVVRRGMLLATGGMVLGAFGSFAITRILSRFLFGVTAHDPAPFLVAPLVLGGMALLACYIPARRALRVDPITALRVD